MVLYNFKLHHFLYPQLFILFNLFIITNFFSPLTTFTSALSFNFTSFVSPKKNFTSFNCYDSDISCQGSAETENRAIQLTGSKLAQALKGRTTYFKSMQLWDKVSGQISDFNTHFSFAIDAQNQTVYRDGLAFFPASNDSKIPTDTNGSTLGLTISQQALDSRDNPFVAVEFDIFYNVEWDPPGEHVGIDINSMKSATTSSWLSNISVREGKINEALISYNPSSHNLSVVFTGFADDGTVMQSLSINVDLSRFLPEWVTFGFSAATGSASAIHTIYSWDFASSLETKKKNKKVSLYVALGIVSFLVVVGAMVVFILCRTGHLSECIVVLRKVLGYLCKLLC